MFKTEGQETRQGGGINKTFEPGVVNAHIYNAIVRTAKSGKKSLEFILEGPALENFEGWAIDKDNPEGPKFKGQTARVNATIYISDFESDDLKKNDILNKIVIIADVLGVRKKVDALSKDTTITTIEEWVAKAVEILKGKDLFWFLTGKEDEYNGKVIVRLSLPKYKFVADEESGVPKFDKNNKYHYTPMANKTVNGFEPAGNDFDL